MENTPLLNSDILNQELLTQLRTPTFLKTQLDVVYSDINNWDNEGLLYYAQENKKGSQKRLSYIEYTWVKIIEELKKYNFSDNDIKSYRDELLLPIDKNLFEEILNNQLLHLDLSEREKLDFIKTDKSEVIAELCILEIEHLIINSVVKKLDANILFFKSPSMAICVAKNAFDAMDNKVMDELRRLMRETHLNLSLMPIIEKFIKGNCVDTSKQMILSNEEYRMITEVRKRIKDIKTLTVRYRDSGVIDRVDIHSMKSVKAESNLMGILKSSDYSSIEMITEKGKIVCVNHTEKIRI